jgi:hypothetical protein
LATTVPARETLGPNTLVVEAVVGLTCTT